MDKQEYAELKVMILNDQPFVRQLLRSVVQDRAKDVAALVVPGRTVPEGMLTYAEAAALIEVKPAYIRKGVYLGHYEGGDGYVDSHGFNDWVMCHSESKVRERLMKSLGLLEEEPIEEVEVAEVCTAAPELPFAQEEEHEVINTEEPAAAPWGRWRQPHIEHPYARPRHARRQKRSRRSARTGRTTSSSREGGLRGPPGVATSTSPAPA